MSKKLLLGLFAGLLASIGAHASVDLSYNYVQVEYVSVEIDNGPDGDGFGIAGSAEVGSQVHVLASYGKTDLDSCGRCEGVIQGGALFPTPQALPLGGYLVDVTTWSAGVGYHTDIARKASFFGEVGYVDVELDSNIGDVSDDGFSAAIGIRGLVASKIELVGGISYVDLSDAGDDTAFSAGIRFNVTNTVSLGAEYTTSDDSDAVRVGVRIYWGSRR